MCFHVACAKNVCNRQCHLCDTSGGCTRHPWDFDFLFHGINNSLEECLLFSQEPCATFGCMCHLSSCRHYSSCIFLSLSLSLSTLAYSFSLHRIALPVPSSQLVVDLPSPKAASVRKSRGAKEEAVRREERREEKKRKERIEWDDAIALSLHLIAQFTLLQEGREKSKSRVRSLPCSRWPLFDA